MTIWQNDIKILIKSDVFIAIKVLLEASESGSCKDPKVGGDTKTNMKQEATILQGTTGLGGHEALGLKGSYRGGTTNAKR